jgi:ribosomal subunit interface protein
MRTEVRWRQTDALPQVEQIVEKRVERLKRVVGRFDPGSGGVELIVQIEHMAKRDLFEVSGNLHLTTAHRLYAREENHDLHVAIGQMFDDLARQVRKVKTHVVTERKSALPMNEAADLMAEEEGGEDEEEPEVERRSNAALEEELGRQLTREQVSRLGRTVRRELRYRMTQHDLDEELIDPSAVLDEAVAATLERLQGGGGARGVEAILVQEAMSAVQSRVTELLEETNRADISTEQMAPVAPRSEESGSNSRNWSELVDLDEPRLLYESLLPGGEATPEEVTEILEMEERIDSILSKHPPVMRNVFLLMTLENLTEEQVARALGINEDSVRVHLREAREVVRRELEQEMSPTWRRILAGERRGGL